MSEPETVDEAGQSAASYRDLMAQSLSDPEAFWGAAAQDITWIKRPKKVLDDSRAPFYDWFPDGVLNVCFNALDRHVIHGRADQTALIYDSPVTGTQRRYTYAELLDQVARCAGVLRHLGVDQGDRVVIYLPMIPEAVISMLACARIGAVHSVVFGGFAPAELAARIEDAEPKVIVSASCGIEPTRIVEYKPMLDEAIRRSSHQPDYTIIVQREQALAEMGERDLDWKLLMKPDAIAPAECVAVAATDPLYVLYTSGTTGKPKGIVRDSGGYAVALRWSMTNLFGVYAPLLAGATTILFEGKPVGTPDAGDYWRLVQEHSVVAAFSAPTSIRATSERRTVEPSWLARRMMAPNSSGVCSWPRTSTVAATFWPIGFGCAPMRPAATWAFCAAIAVATSSAERLRPSMRSGSSHIRIARGEAKTCARPTPSIRRISPTTLRLR